MGRIPNNRSFQGNPNNDAVNDSASNFFASNDKGQTAAATLNQNGCVFLRVESPTSQLRRARVVTEKIPKSLKTQPQTLKSVG